MGNSIAKFISEHRMRQYQDATQAAAAVPSASAAPVDIFENPANATTANPADVASYNDADTVGFRWLSLFSLPSRVFTAVRNYWSGAPTSYEQKAPEVSILPQVFPEMPAGVMKTLADLTEEQRNDLLVEGEYVVLPDVVVDKVQSASVLKFIPNDQPKQVAERMSALFWDMNNQSAFVPGMTSTEVTQWGGKQAIVLHYISPLTFFGDLAQRLLPRSIYHSTAYSYSLLYEVYKEGDEYHVSWAIPQELSSAGEHENGDIRFTPMAGGTLITYNNATEPFMFEQAQEVLAPRIMSRINETASRMGGDYFLRTVQNFVDRYNSLPVNVMDNYYVVWMREALKRPGSESVKA